MAQTPLKIDYSPKSPEVSPLFEFTDITTGNYTGRTNINIPISGLSEGPLSTAISLSYNASGHKVTQRATWVGLGWNLNAGGQIAREVRGIADDAYPARGFLHFLDFHNFSSISDIQNLSEIDKIDLYEDLVNFGCQDAEPDVFSFSVGNLSGSFMFDWDGSIKVACNRKIDVNFTQAANSYEINQWDIIDDLGNKYVFSKKEINDVTGIYGMGVLNCANNPYTTAWKLTSMEDHSGQHRIDFTYEDYTMNYPIEYSKQESINSAGAVIAGGLDSSGSGFQIDGSYLKSITTNNSQYSIEFSTDLVTPRTDVSGTNLYPLGTVKLKDNHNSIIKEYEFKYTQGNRLQLDEINQITPSSTLNLYNFEYNPTPLPDYISYAKDHWGYYNGVSSNTVPYPPFTIISSSGVPIVHLGADKNPNETYSEAGVLKKITYPTKGYSEFVYESHDYSFIQSTQIPNEYGQTSQSTLAQADANPNDGAELVEDIKYFDVIINRTTDNENTICIADEPCLRRIDIQVTGVNNCVFGGNTFGPRYAIYDSNNNQVYGQSNTPPYDPEYENGALYNEIETIWLPEGTYRIVAGTKNCNSASIVNFIHVNPIWYNDTNLLYKKDAGGLRIQKITEYDHDGTLLKKRNFEYILNDTPTISSGSIDALPRYNDTFTYFSNPPNIESVFVRYSGSLLQLGSSFGHVRYKEVTVKQDDGSNVLKTVYKYSNGEDDIISFVKPYPPASSKAYKKGLLMSETVYKTVSTINNIFDPVRETTYLYNYKTFSIEGLKIGREISGDCGFCAPGLDIYAEGYYTNYIGYNQLVNKKVETHFDSSTIEQEDTFTFDANLNRITTALNSTSNNETILSTYTYPDTDSPSSINTTMVSKNIIGTPVQTEISKNGSLLSTQYIKYKVWGNNLILPEFLQVVKGVITINNPIEDRTVIYNYDSNGNPLEVSKADDIHTVYIWGYNKQYPIAKIENFTYVGGIPSSLQSVIDTAITASDNDINASTENNLRTALDALHNDPNLQNALITTYTFDPLIGIKSITDPRGYVMYYEYDEFNRLKHVKDQDNHILSENEYNYTPQN